MMGLFKTTPVNFISHYHMTRAKRTKRVDVCEALGNPLTTKTKGVSLSGSRTTHENNVIHTVRLHRDIPKTMLLKKGAKRELHHKVTGFTTHEVVVHVSSSSVV